MLNIVEYQLLLFITVIITIVIITILMITIIIVTTITIIIVTIVLIIVSGIPFPLQKPVSCDPYKQFVRAYSVEFFDGVTLVFVVLRYFCRHFCLVQKRCSNCMNLEVGSPGKPRSFL